MKIRDQIKGSEFLSTIRDRFGDPERGEKYFRLNVEDRLAFFGQDVIFVASIVTDDDLAEVCRVGAALAKYGARRVTYVAAFEAYTKMERAVKPGEAVTAKVIARQLSQIPQGDLRNCFLFMDLHTAGFIHYFEGECLRFEIYAEPVLVEAIRELNLENLMFGTADLSRVKWAKTYARIFGTRIAIVDKARDFKTTHVDSVIGDVRGMNVMIYDDMTCTGGSLIDGGDAYIQCGAIGVYAVVSHLALDLPKYTFELKR